jgi:quercetin dioxygenase-like cupin family protein
MAEEVRFEHVDTKKEGSFSVELCKGEINGARPVHHKIVSGDSMSFGAGVGYYHILILLEGEAVYATNGKEYHFSERTTFVSDPKKDLSVSALKDTRILEIQWDEEDGDEADLKEYKTVFPVVVPYQDSIQYIDPNKSEKTISRMMIPHEIIPRFTIGSVESYGYDLVRPHAHPMLDQFFYSFAENDMEVIIDGGKYNMKGDEIIHIPLGSNHGAEVTGDRHMHYMWVDFMPDKEAGLKRLNFSHRPTGTVRDFANEDKHR